MDIEVLIKAFAKAKRIKPSEFPKFREQIIIGLERMGFGKEVDIEKYKEAVKNGRLHEKQSGHP